MLLQVAALPVLGREHEVQVVEEVVHVVGVLVHARRALRADSLIGSKYCIRIQMLKDISVNEYLIRYLVKTNLLIQYT